MNIWREYVIFIIIFNKIMETICRGKTDPTCLVRYDFSNLKIYPLKPVTSNKALNHQSEKEEGKKEKGIYRPDLGLINMKDILEF